MRRAVIDALLKLDPRLMVHKPVMFVIYVGSIWTTLLFVRDAPRSTGTDNLFTGLVVLFLWSTVLFGNFADAMAEGRGKAHADALRRARQETVAHILQPDAPWWTHPPRS